MLISNIPTSLIREEGLYLREVNEYYRDLCNSIKELGVLRPITIRKEGGYYKLVDGRARFYVAKELGLETMPAYVR